jgi:hypothetical protein
MASAECTAIRPLKQAQLHFTSDTGPLVERRWQSLKAEIRDGKVVAQLPKAATIWMLSVGDDRGAMVSTGVVFAE